MAKEDAEQSRHLEPEIYHAQDPLSVRRLTPRRDAPDLNLFDPFAPPGNFLAFFARGDVYVMQEFAIVDGAMELVRVDVRGYAGADSETTAVVRYDDLAMPTVKMRDAALGKHREAAALVLRVSQDELPDSASGTEEDPGFAVQIHDFATEHAAAVSARGRKRPPPIPLDLVQQVADMYKEIMSSTRNPPVKAPNVEIARRLGLPLSKVNRIVQKARSLGYLPKSTRGVTKI